jgi:hypothetical protein
MDGREVTRSKCPLQDPRCWVVEALSLVNAGKRSGGFTLGRGLELSILPKGGNKRARVDWEEAACARRGQDGELRR